MSRSAIVMLVAGAVLLGVAAVVFQHYWPAVTLMGTGLRVIVISLAAYGALLAAVMIRRIAEPSLPMPILAWIIAFVWVIIGALGQSEESRERELLHGNPTPDRSSSFGKHGTGMGWAIFLTLVALGMYVTGLGLTSHLARGLVEAPPPATGAPPTSPTTAGTAPARPAAPPRDVMDTPDLASAIAFVRDHTSDDGEPSTGSQQLARWLASHGTWATVAVTRSETSVELIEKDPAKQRGKKLCVAGTLERIEKQSLAGTEVHAARLITAQRDAVEVYAVGNTGALVKRKPARFCGVVTGAIRGRTGTTGFAVGMFDTNK